MSAAGCTAVYTLVSYLCGWFDKKPDVTAWFAVFLLFGYACLFFVNRIKRGADTKRLNELLTLYQNKGKTQSAKAGMEEKVE